MNSVDQVDIVLVPDNFQNFQTLFIADDQGYTGLSVNGYGFALNNQLNLKKGIDEHGYLYNSKSVLEFVKTR